MAVGDAGVGRAPAPPQSSGCSVRHLLRDEDESAARGKEESVSRVVAQRVGRHRGGERGPCGQRGAAGPGPRSCGAVAGRGGADLRPQSSAVLGKTREWSDSGFRKMSPDAERRVGVGTGRGEP